MTTEALQLQWQESVDSELSRSTGKRWPVWWVAFKTGDRVYVQDDGDGEFSVTGTTPEDAPFFVQTGFKTKIAAQKWFEENALDLIPGLLEHLK